jgi:hypothetical protein
MDQQFAIGQIVLATAEHCIQNSGTTTEDGWIVATLLHAMSVTQRITFGTSITIMVDLDSDPDLLSSSISERKQLENVLHQQVNPGNLTVTLVKWSHATKSRRWVTLSFDWRLGVTFQIAESPLTMTDG